MFKNISIRTKLTGLIIFLVVITVVISGYISYSIRKSLLEDNYLKNLQALADMKVDKINAFVDKAEGDIQVVSHLEEVKTYLDSTALVASAATPADSSAMATTTMEETKPVDAAPAHIALEGFAKTVGGHDIFLTDAQGKILLSTSDTSQAENIRQTVGGYDDSIALNSRKGTYFSRIYKEGKKFFITAGAPVKGTGNELVGLVFIKLDLSEIYELLGENLQFGNTTEAILSQKRKNRAIILNPLKSDPEAAMVRGVGYNENKGTAIQEATLGQAGKGYALDYLGNEELAVWLADFITELGLGRKNRYERSARRRLHCGKKVCHLCRCHTSFCRPTGYIVFAVFYKPFAFFKRYVALSLQRRFAR